MLLLAVPYACWDLVRLELGFHTPAWLPQRITPSSHLRPLVRPPAAHKLLLALPPRLLHHPPTALGAAGQAAQERGGEVWSSGGQVFNLQLAGHNRALGEGANEVQGGQLAHCQAHLTARRPAMAACMDARWLSPPRISGAADRWHSMSSRSRSQTSVKAAGSRGRCEVGIWCGSAAARPVAAKAVWLSHDRGKVSRQNPTSTASAAPAAAAAAAAVTAAAVTAAAPAAARATHMAPR